MMRRLGRDIRGNAVLLMAGALLPVLAATGSAVDIARAYMARTRLQLAVDSAALAGRRARIGSGMTEATTAANQFLTFNFPKTAYGASAADWSQSITGPDNVSVQVTASTRMPTTVMKVFGFQTIAISATSIATQNWFNTDILLVLDVTGSMAETLRGDNASKMTGLRNAVMSLYDTLAQPQADLKSRGLRLRYGVLPYSSAVNVGRLLQAEATATGGAYLRTSAPYLKCTSSSWWGCSDYGNQTVTITSSMLSTSNWAGCIEERKTLNTISWNPSNLTIPSGAKDLDIDLMPSAGDPDSQWAPLLPNVMEGESGSYCPREGLLLKEDMTRSEMQTYVNSLTATGATYHDIGMIWGTRMISPGGVFPNPTEYGGAKVQRYIIFMTDGEMAPDRGIYSSYGVEDYQRRVTGNSISELTARHRQRFLMACNAAKSLQISIWTIGFGTGANADLTSCASGTDMAVLASNQTELIQRFQDIGRAIGKLRLSQ